MSVSIRVRYVELVRKPHFMRQFREILLSEPGFAGLVDGQDWERDSKVPLKK